MVAKRMKMNTVKKMMFAKSAKELIKAEISLFIAEKKL
jgi:hypothetical protein